MGSTDRPDGKHREKSGFEKRGGYPSGKPNSSPPPPPRGSGAGSKPPSAGGNHQNGGKN